MVKQPKMHINYPKIVDNAMRDIAKNLLKSVERDGLPGEHYFLISFLTSSSEVKISERIKKKYPAEMTIVIQHQYQNLKVNNDVLNITLSFDGIKEDVEIPFDYFTSFVDPSTRFALQFNPDLVDKKVNKGIKRGKEASLDKKLKESKDNDLAKVIVLDNFRNKSN